MKKLERHECMDNVDAAEVQILSGGRLREVPGLRCRICGEQYLEPETVRSLERQRDEERAREQT